MKKVIVYTHAYNAQATIGRTIESIINQTYKDWTYYCVDNGSTDRTGEIIRQYAEKDSRVIPLANKQNHVYEKGNAIFEIMDFDMSEYYCALDADDEYKSDFLEKMTALIEKEALDVIACGSDFIDSRTNQLQGVRKLNNNLILEGADFGKYFSSIHQFMRTIWGKLYRTSLLKQCNCTNYLNNFHEITYGADTLFTMHVFLKSNRAGILAGTFHKYYVSPKTVSYKMDNKRINSDRILYDEAINFLIGKVGFISPQNEEFLNAIYFNAIKDTLNVVLNAQISVPEKMKLIQEIFICQYTQELIQHNYASISSALNKLRGAVLKWLLVQKECRRDEGAETVVEILADMYKDLPQLITQDNLKYIISKMPEIVEYLLQKDYNRVLERLQTWFKRHDADIPALTGLEIDAYHALNKPDDEIFTLYTSIRKDRPQSSMSLDIDLRSKKLMEKYPLLKNMSVSLASAFPYAIRWAMKGNYKQALDAFVSVQNIVVNDDDTEVYIMFAQNLSAAAENTDAYIYFKKVWISYLIDCSRIGEAIKELDEMESLLPDDEEFIELRKRLDA
ncbi:MAG: glycosyltransferase [Syntrophomonadaceae bacterium]|jgi:glycosyltransferase involved in cell wall biosynthesis|nr:glycosyltransferase [Syntrophomonadaceae bacterium]